ncbi:efflux RND transporter periplasmic adaptor subunit [Vibrio sp. HN007]|uniref:efflux RND transporter periplasmic adaptor subunit n=1 Tax=Vibrio iocasae TaxID=3098914 RepID=UPI0035D4FC81
MARFSWVQKVLFIPPVLVGALLLALAPSMKAEPPKVEKKPGKKVVRVLKVSPRKIQPTAIGYGHTQPVQEWEAQSELDGSVVWVSEQFQTGALLEAGSEIAKLDPSAYQLTVARLEAELEVSQLTSQTIQASLNIAEKEYQVQKAEYDRSIRLSKTGHISQTEKDKATRELLSSQQQLQTQKNNLAINKAQQQVIKTELDLAKRDLEQTVIVAPYPIRITEKYIDLAEYVNKSELMFKADGIEAVEINAQFPLGKMRPLRRATNLSTMDNKVHENLSATIELQAGDRIIAWDAIVSRSGGQVDAQTQSQSIVVQIPEPYKQAVPGKKPPLIRDTFVKVTLKAPVMKKQILVPVTAIHDGKAYVLSEGKLNIRPVSIDFVQGQVAVIKSGLEKDDIVILSKLSPAVEGMSLKPQPDKKINKWLDKETGFKAGKPGTKQKPESSEAKS